MISKFIERISEDPRILTREDVRAFLKWLKETESGNYKNTLSALKVFYRDFLGRPEVVSSFKFPPKTVRVVRMVPTENLRTFYRELRQPRAKAMFMLYATSGLRRNELLSLKRRNVDPELRMIIPEGNGSRTKRTYVTFYNRETAKILKEILPEDPEARVFPVSSNYFQKKSLEIRTKVGVILTPQILREWFCSQMGELGVPDRYVDAFCGRVPRSILARHYTDYSPDKLKRIYDKANIKVLS